MNKNEMQRYEVEPSALWNRLLMTGYSGYDTIEAVEGKGWHAIPSWGERGWDLGSWPLVIIFCGNHRIKDDPARLDPTKFVQTLHWGDNQVPQVTYDIAYYCEGDIVTYKCPTQKIRSQIIDTLAFFHWKAQEESWVAGIESVDQLPPDMRGPYWDRDNMLAVMASEPDREESRA